MNERYFDLNIEKILEGWQIRHAIRELIANALDEEVLSGSPDIEIRQEAGGTWHIRDFGRGLKYEHLTQNENTEKLANPNRVIGKFGVGLKDALATLDRHGVRVTVKSRHNEIALRSAPKHGFSDVITLHAEVRPASEPSFVGTDISLAGVDAGEVQHAKEFFLKFTGESVLDETPYGQILERAPGRKARIYVSGLLVAEEENFTFCYNITSLTAAMRRALNRERTNVGRTAYSDRVKQMLLSSRSAAVASALAADLAAMERGTEHDEVHWTEVAAHACEILNAQKKVVFVTAKDHTALRATVEQAITDGYQIVTIPDTIRHALTGRTDTLGAPLRDLTFVSQEWAKSFEFRFINPKDLTPAEKRTFDQWKRVADVAGGLPSNVREIKISETMRPDVFGGHDAVGLWDPENGRIIIKHCQLSSTARFAGTLLHEIVHAKTGYGDVSREFESELTQMLGDVAALHLSK